MRNRKSISFGMLLLFCSVFSGGCIDGVRFGVQDGVEGAIAGVIETLVTSALEPLLPVAE